MTSNDFNVIHVLQTFSDAIHCTATQQLPRFRQT